VSNDQPTKDLFEDETLTATHSFILKFWLEEPPTETTKAIWRGRLTHVPSNTQIYVKNMEELIAFINLYIHISYGDEIELKPRLVTRIRRLLNHWLP
jgi:hypothetical protein